MHTTTHIHIAGNRFSIERGLKEVAALYQLAGLDFQHGYLLLEIDDDRDVPLAPSDCIVVNGDVRFSIAHGAYPTNDDNPQLRKPLRPVMNDEEIPRTVELDRAKCTFSQLCALDIHFEAGDGVFVEMGDIPDAQITENMRLVVKAPDRFYTSPCGNVGFDERLAKDIELAKRRYGEVDCVADGTRSIIVFKSQPLPAHWNRPTTDVLIQIPQGYPMAALDMFWVPTGMRLKDGRMPVNADSIEAFNGHPWQRFSWHYPQSHAWNPAVDGLLSHMRFVRVRLAQAS